MVQTLKEEEEEIDYKKLAQDEVERAEKLGKCSAKKMYSTAKSYASNVVRSIGTLKVKIIKGKDNIVNKVSESFNYYFYRVVEKFAVRAQRIETEDEDLDLQEPLKLEEEEEETTSQKELFAELELTEDHIAKATEMIELSLKDSKNKTSLWEKIDSLGQESTKFVCEEIFGKKFEETYFMKLYMKTPRKSPIPEVVEDLKCFLGEDDNKKLDKYAKIENPLTAVMHMWTRLTNLTTRINFALILDGYNTFRITDKSKDIMEKHLNENRFTYKYIIEKSIKFMRMVNYCIVSKCSEHNTEDRETHRGIRAEIFQNIEKGQSFRVMQFLCTSEKEEIAKQFITGNEDFVEEKTLVHFQIPKG
jgi:hypothetical protein